MEYGFLDQTLQQLCQGLRAWEVEALRSCFLLERKLVPLVMDNGIWGDQPVWKMQGHRLSASQSVDSLSWHLQPWGLLPFPSGLHPVLGVSRRDLFQSRWKMNAHMALTFPVPGRDCHDQMQLGEERGSQSRNLEARNETETRKECSFQACSQTQSAASVM